MGLPASPWTPHARSIARELSSDQGLFAADCKAEAFASAKLHHGSVCRGHLVIDSRLLLEHWWVTRDGRVLDPTFLTARGPRLDLGRLAYVPLPTDQCGRFDDAPWTGCMVSWGECSESTPCEWCNARHELIRKFPALRPGEIIIAEAKQPDTARKVKIMQQQTPFEEITNAVVDGSKAGAAFAVASDLTELVLVASGAKEHLPAWFHKGRPGEKLLPVFLCYGIAFATVLIPGIPKADRIRSIAAFAAKGAAAVAVAEWMPSIKGIVPQILGLAELHELKS